MAATPWCSMPPSLPRRACLLFLIRAKACPCLSATTCWPLSNKRLGSPSTTTKPRCCASAAADLEAQANPEADAGDLAERYPKAQIRDFDGDPKRVTEMDALVAYLQMLGTLVDVNSAAAQEELAQERGR